MRVIRSCYKWVAFRIERCTVETNADSYIYVGQANFPTHNLMGAIVATLWG